MAPLPVRAEDMDLEAFKTYLRQHGVDRITITDARERMVAYVMRATPSHSRSEIHSVTLHKNGTIEWKGWSNKHYKDMLAGRGVGMPCESLSNSKLGQKRKNVDDSNQHGMASRIRMRDGNCCWYCGEILKYQEQTFEHLLPKSIGGGMTSANIVLTHQDCNALAGTLALAQKIELREIMRKYGRRQVLDGHRMKNRRIEFCLSDGVKDAQPACSESSIGMLETAQGRSGRSGAGEPAPGREPEKRPEGRVNDAGVVSVAGSRELPRHRYQLRHGSSIYGFKPEPSNEVWLQQGFWSGY